LPKAPSVSLTKMIEATKLHPRTGLSLGLPPATIPYGALIEPKGSERDRERFLYLGELYECKRDLFLSATGGAESAAKVEDEPETAPAETIEKAEPPAVSGPRLEWKRLNSSEYTVRRAAVPGGWLVALQGGVTFLPDAKHRWDGGSVE
jgi:hypothetical protein